MKNFIGNPRLGNTRPITNQQDLSNRLRFEKGNARLAKALLTEYNSNENVLKNALDILVSTIRTDWAHICERIQPDDSGVSFQCIVQSTTMEPHSAPEMAKVGAEILNRWQRSLSLGESILGPTSTFPPEEQLFFSSMGIQSVMMIPIISGKRFFGFVSLEDRQNQRNWRYEEVQMVETAALIIGAYLTREEREKNLKKTTEAAEKAKRMKSTFVSNISHEIRTPLNGIIGSAEVLKGTDNISEVHKYADTILKEAKYLFDLVNGLFDHAKLEAEEMSLDPAPLDLTALLLDVETNARLATNKKNLRFKINIHKLPLKVLADGPRLRQVLSNLISNAVKFTKRGEVRLEVELLSTADKTATIRFSIIDTGIGIDEKHQQQIFESFRQADESRTRNFGGTGLGITIANQLVNLMGGRILLASAPGQGSRFWFDITFTVLANRAISNNPINDSNDENPAFASLNILAAEDHPTNQMVIRHYIERNGHRATIAANGREVLRICNTEKFDIILMDVQMPKMDGIEATVKLRAGNSINKNVPIIAITASDDKETRNNCLDSGMNDIVTKPLLFERLIDILDRWTETTETSAAPAAQTAASPESNLSPIDYPALMERLDGDADFARTLLIGFCNQTDKMLAEMAEALKKDDMESLRQAAHTIKGGALNIVATDLRQAAMNLEESTKLKSGDAAALLTQIETAYQRLKHYIQNEMSA